MFGLPFLLSLFSVLTFSFFSLLFSSLFSVYDVSSSEVRESECIGSVLCRLQDIVSAPGELMYSLLHEDPMKAERVKGAVIIVTYERDGDSEDEEEDEEDEEDEPAAPRPGFRPAGSASAGRPASVAATPARGRAIGGMLAASPSGASSSEDEDEEGTPARPRAPPARAPERLPDSPDSDSDDFSVELAA